MSIFNKRISILVLGSDGMLGHDVYEHFMSESFMKNSNIGAVFGLDLSSGFDITKENSLVYFFHSHEHIDWCINCIAYTNTAAEENTEEGKSLGYKLNSFVPMIIAWACKIHKTKLIHISTDYVFGGTTTKLNMPSSCPWPVNNYGMHKLLGEEFIKNIIGPESKDWTILRTSWLYGQHNEKSFIHKFLRNVVKCIAEGKQIECDSFEHSIPTSVECVIRCICQTINENCYGIMHAVPKLTDQDNDGVMRYTFATEILYALERHGMDDIAGKNIADIEIVETCNKSYYPKYSTMATSFTCVYTWTGEIDRFVKTHIDDIHKFVSNEIVKYPQLMQTYSISS